MHSSTEQFILQEVQPRLKAAIAQSVPLVGAEDVQELVQDGTVIALRLLDSATRSGRKVTGGNLAFYTVKMLRSGRRSTGERRNDPLHPKAQLNGTCSVQSLDEPVGLGEADEPLTLGESLAARTEDPSVTATRRLDWEPLVAALDPTAREVLGCLVEGEDLTTLVPKLRRSRSALQQDKERLARLVCEHLGQDILLQIQGHPRWMDNVAANREKLACRYERQAA
jgi:hypothetical protein